MYNMSMLLNSKKAKIAFQQAFLKRAGQNFIHVKQCVSSMSGSFHPTLSENHTWLCRADLSSLLQWAAPQPTGVGAR